MTETPRDGPEQLADGVAGHPAGPTASPADGQSGETRMMRCRTVATERLRHRHHIRDLEPMGSGANAAEPSSLLSADEEPHPCEMLLAALGACLTISIQANAVARGIPLRTLELHSGGVVDSAALWGTGDRRARPLGFQSITIEVRIAADAPRDALKALVDHAVLWSPLANTLHDPVDLHVSLIDGDTI